MKLPTLAIIGMLSVGCASTPGPDVTYRPVIDTEGVDLNEMSSDMRSCNQFTKERLSAGQGAARGAVAGGILGGVIMTAVTGNSDHLGRGIAVGALGGAASGASDARQTQKGIMRRCMSGRGYTVLD